MTHKKLSEREVASLWRLGCGCPSPTPAAARHAKSLMAVLKSYEESLWRHLIDARVQMECSPVVSLMSIIRVETRITPASPEIIHHINPPARRKLFKNLTLLEP